MKDYRNINLLFGSIIVILMLLRLSLGFDKEIKINISGTKDYVSIYDQDLSKYDIKVSYKNKPDFSKVNDNAYLCDTSIMLDMIEYHKIKHKYVVLRQAVWESGWFSCGQCSMRYNNPFGFRLKSKANEDNPKGYLKFDCIEDAVIYYKKWQDKHYKNGDYYQFLIDRHYAHDSYKYIKHLKSLKL